MCWRRARSSCATTARCASSRAWRSRCASRRGAVEGPGRAGRERPHLPRRSARAATRPAGTTTSATIGRSSPASRAAAGCSTCTATAAASRSRRRRRAPRRCWRSTARRAASTSRWRAPSATALPACSRPSARTRSPRSTRLAADKQRFDLVIADPPAFVRSKRELKPGLRGYRKLARACGALVAEAGFLVIACCSHNVPAEAFADEVQRGLARCRSRRPAAAPRRRRPGSSGPSGAAGIRLLKVPVLRARLTI